MTKLRCSAKAPSLVISLDFRDPGIHASRMKILVILAIIQFLNLAIFAWFNRVAALPIRILLSITGNIDDFADEGKLAAYHGIVPRLSVQTRLKS
jgi:phosphoglycerol transferase MdoB-like AlkP superfamily enzyme